MFYNRNIHIRIIFFVILISSLQQYGSGQDSTYYINRTDFSSEKNDEFSPVFFRNGIVFCSTRDNNPFINYSASSRHINIFFIDTTKKVTWEKATLFSKDLTTRLNEGPVTFSKTFDTVYYSRNQRITGNLGNISAASNRLGIYMAVFDKGRWKEADAFRFNNEWYNITTPYLSADGKTIYFASDMPGGYGGSDLYYAVMDKGYWGEPVNLGPVINSEANEAYPFVNGAGELFFSSDRKSGIGGRDIYYSWYTGNSWLDPLLLDQPLNSEYDDFGLIADDSFSSGYFSSNRLGSIDVFMFSEIWPQIFYTEEQKENNFCYSFTANNSPELRLHNLEYEWDFGDGNKIRGNEVKHCFQGSGKYLIKQSLVDSESGFTFFVKEIRELRILRSEQPVITVSGPVISNDMMQVDADRSYLPGYEILNYSWDFGDGGRATGEEAVYIYDDPGNYIVKLGLTVKDIKTGKIYKKGVFRKVKVYQDNDIPEDGPQGAATVSYEKVENTDQADLVNIYSADKEKRDGTVYRIELMSSDRPVDLNDRRFDNIRNMTFVKEEYSDSDGAYKYIIDEQLNLFDTYLTFKKVITMGFRDAKVSTHIPVNSSEKGLAGLKKIFSLSTDNFFLSGSNRLSLDALPLLDQVVRLMDDDPEVSLIVAVYSDNNGSAPANKQMTRQRAESVVDYMIRQGIDRSRFTSTGFGESKPVDLNTSAKGRQRNRRVELVFFKNQ